MFDALIIFDNLLPYMLFSNSDTSDLPSVWTFCDQMFQNFLENHFKYLCFTKVYACAQAVISVTNEFLLGLQQKPFVSENIMKDICNVRMLIHICRFVKNIHFDNLEYVILQDLWQKMPDHNKLAVLRGKYPGGVLNNDPTAIGIRKGLPAPLPQGLYLM